MFLIKAVNHWLNDRSLVIERLLGPAETLFPAVGLSQCGLLRVVPWVSCASILLSSTTACIIVILLIICIILTRSLLLIVIIRAAIIIVVIIRLFCIVIFCISAKQLIKRHPLHSWLFLFILLILIILLIRVLTFIILLLWLVILWALIKLMLNLRSSLIVSVVILGGFLEPVLLVWLLLIWELSAPIWWLLLDGFDKLLDVQVALALLVYHSILATLIICTALVVIIVIIRLRRRHWLTATFFHWTLRSLFTQPRPATIPWLRPAPVMLPAPSHPLHGHLLGWPVTGWLGINLVTFNYQILLHQPPSLINVIRVLTDYCTLLMSRILLLLLIKRLLCTLPLKRLSPHWLLLKTVINTLVVNYVVAKNLNLWVCWWR